MKALQKIKMLFKTKPQEFRELEMEMCGEQVKFLINHLKGLRQTFESRETHQRNNEELLKAEATKRARLDVNKRLREIKKRGFDID